MEKRLLKRLRKKTSIPIIFLTSKDEEIDELLRFKTWVLMILLKNQVVFQSKVLIERIRVQLRKKSTRNRRK